MKKWLTRCAGTAALTLIVLLTTGAEPNIPEIQVGNPLPSGKVKPKLINLWDTALLLAPDGTLWAWGGSDFNLKGVFSDPAFTQVPRRIGSDSDWTDVTANGARSFFTAALKSDGSLWAWGWNGDGAVGQPNLTNHFVMPTRIGKETNWTNICAGCYHILALKNDGSLWAWGYNNFGQLGDGTTMSRSVPTIIGTDRDWRTTAVAMFASFALKTNGTLWSWGHGQSNNCLGPTQVGSDTDWLAISACDRATLLALKTDGGLFSMAYRGDRDAFTPVLTQIGRDTDWVEIYAGPGAFWGRKRNGSGRARVESPPKRGLYVPSPPSMPLPLSFDPWAFAPGSRTSLLLSKDGKLWTWGARMGASESTNDQTPHLLWELPPEVRRSLGTGAKGTTSDGTKTQSPNAPEK